MGTLFEVYIQTAGTWRIAAVFDERDSAIAEAQALAKRPTVDAVRVSYDTWDPETQRMIARTVYRQSRQQESIRRKAADAMLDAHAKRLLSQPYGGKAATEQRLGTRLRRLAGTALRLGIVFGGVVGFIYVAAGFGDIVKTLAGAIR